MADVTREAALEDISRLVRIVAESHPDPFRHASSQISFYEGVETVISEMRSDRVSPAELFVAASRVAALVGDGHTSIDVPDLGLKRLWLELEPLDGRLVVTGTYREGDAGLLGSSVESIGGVNVETLLGRVRNKLSG